MAVKMRTLTRLQWRRFLKSSSRGKLYGDIFGVAYFWIIELVLFFVMKKEGVEIPPLAVALVAAGFTIPDLIMKFIMEHDNSVMDAFMKTRPVPQSLWERFLALSQFWYESNLVMPLALLPACFLFIPPAGGFFLFLFLYLASVFGGFIVMVVKHRSNYQPEKAVKSYLAKSVKSSRGNFVSGLQFRSFLRSKRLRSSLIYLAIIFYINCVTYSLGNNGKYANFYIFLFIYMLACSIPQWGFAVEANFFNGIWTRPVAIEKLLANKYRFGILSGAAGGMLCLPICIWSDTVTMPDIFASVIFCCCAGNLFLLTDAYNCVPFDLFGKTFFNTQGSSATYKGSTIITLLVTMGIGIACVFALPGWKSQLILTSFGIAGLVAYKPFFSWVVRRFMKNRYKYMEKYTSK